MIGQNPQAPVALGPGRSPARGWSAPVSLGTWIVWHALTVAGLLFAASQLQLRVPLWALPPAHRFSLGGLVAAYVIVAAAVMWRASRPSGVRFRDLLVTVATIFGAFSFALLLAEAPYSRLVLIAAVASTILANCIPFAPMFRRVLIPLVVLQVAGIAWLTQAGIAQQERRVLSTTFYDVELVVHEGIAPSAIRGGGIEPVNGGLLIATGEGLLHFVPDVTAPTLALRTLPYRVPLNRQDFIRDAVSRAATHNFRVADILLNQTADGVELFVSHHYWNRDRQCFVLRISAATAAREPFLAGTADLAWRTVFDTQPCLSLRTHPGTAPFSGDEIGGRMVMLDPESVLLTVGDLAFDGWSSPETFAQDPDVHYGKTLRVSIRDGSAEIYTIGHRNPQGLAHTPQGQIWLTEHGPRGGDELNLVKRGKNYGWPRVTLGSDYGQRKWPLSTSQGRHTGYEAPAHAWLPSIGVSNLIALRGDLFAMWKGDLLIAALGGTTLIRARVDGERIGFTERMGVGQRVRDLVEAPDGRVFMLFDDSGSIGVLVPVPDIPSDSSPFFTAAMRGQLLFSGCAGCHANDGRGIAPSLAGVVGRPVASDRDYAYSPALRALGGAWTADRLDKFLESPAAFAPGNAMRVDPMREAADRDSLIAYLRTLR